METTAAIASAATVDAENGAATFALARVTQKSPINAIARSRSRSRSRSASPGRRRKRCARAAAYVLLSPLMPSSQRQPGQG